MASATDLLKKNKTSSSFVPKKRRAWDYTPEQLEDKDNLKTQEKANTKSTQIPHKKDIEETHISYKTGTYSPHTHHKVDTNPKQKPHNKHTQTNTTLSSHIQYLPNSKIGFYQLTGVQKSLLKAIFTNIVSTGKTFSDTLSVRHLAELADVNINSIKTSIKRLCDKGFLIRVEEKRGRGGWVIFSLPDIVYAEVHDHYQKDILLLETDFQKNRLTNTKSNTENLHSSSINKITTTSLKANQNLPEEWRNVDYQSLCSIGFSQTQLKQLIHFNTPDNVRESINHFSYALEHNKKYKDHPNPLNVLMGVLRKGETWFECNYESPQDKALREMIERKKREKETQAARIKELIDLEFPGWVTSLSESERLALLPEELIHSKLEAPVTAYLRRYFLDTVLLPRLREKRIIE